jgi:hypothetical protein
MKLSTITEAHVPSQAKINVLADKTFLDLIDKGQIEVGYENYPIDGNIALKKVSDYIGDTLGEKAKVKVLNGWYPQWRTKEINKGDYSVPPEGTQQIKYR